MSEVGGERAMVRAGLRGFLDLSRLDIALCVGLVLLAFVLRFASPILPNFLGGTATPQPPISVLGVGKAYNSDLGACRQIAVNDDPDHDGDAMQTSPKSGVAVSVDTDKDGDSHLTTACGQIFDEVYFPTDAAFDLHSPATISYFDPEPPLTKLLMTPSIQWLGYDTWGWRMSQVITGSLLVGLMYLIALRLRRDRFFATCAALFVTIDGLAFVESRIGVIDMIAVLFVALLYYVFLLHWQARTRRQWRLSLYIMGMVAGLAFAAKLTALAPVVVIGALVLFRGLAPFAAAVFPSLRRLSGPRRYQTILWREAAGRRAPLHYGAALLLAGLIFCGAFARYLTIAHDDVYRFIDCRPDVPGLTTANPATDHLPVPLLTVAGKRILDPVQAVRNIVDIESAGLQYHQHECHGHPYASRWYTWPLTEHPVLFYSGTDPLYDDPSHRGQAAVTDMGNPALWWLGIFALLFCVWRMLAGPMLLRVALGALLAVSLALMVIAFHHAEAPVDATTHSQAGPVGSLGFAFYLGFLGMAVFCAMGVVFAVVSRRFVPAFIVLGYITAWLMWVPGNEQRVLFFYHALGMLIFLALASAYALTWLRQVSFTSRGRWWSLAPLAHAGVAIVVAGFIFFYPVWTAIPQPNADHQMRVWVDTW